MKNGDFYRTIAGLKLQRGEYILVAVQDQNPVAQREPGKGIYHIPTVYYAHDSGKLLTTASKEEATGSRVRPSSINAAEILDVTRLEHRLMQDSPER